MNSIEIEIHGLGYNKMIYIDVINNKVIIDENESSISQAEIDELIRIIRNWKEKYTGNIIDSEKFTIKINTNDGVEIIKGESGYPQNYSAFKDWVGSLYE